MAFIIGFYEVDRVYGGGEEGGWWYDTGDLTRAFRLIKNEDDAYAACRRANHLLTFFQDKNRQIRPVSSVIYSGGRFEANVFENALPTHYPEERPHYE